MSKKIFRSLKTVSNRLTGRKPLLGLLFAMTVLFQVYLITKWTLFYPVLKFLFFFFLLLLLLNLIRLPRRKLLWTLAFILAILAVRIPFYLHDDGMIFSSDNALEALQPLEIRDTHTAPLYLLNSAGHNGTFKYLLVAFVWDVLGRDYLTFVLVQLLFFLAFCRLIFDLFRDAVDRRLLLIFLFTGFMFIEVVFDHSLFLRAGPYLESVVFALLGISVFLGDFRPGVRTFLGAYFCLFGVYIHPVCVFLIVPFLPILLVREAKARRLWSGLGLLAAGVLAGAFAMLFFKLFGPPAEDTGEWFKIILLKPSDITLSAIPSLLARAAGNFWTAFKGLFQTETNYGLHFFHIRPWLSAAFSTINTLLLAVSTAALAGGIFLAVRSVWPGRPKAHWSRPFFLLLLLTILGKIGLMLPKPFMEPRHNWDLTILIILAYFFVLSEFVKFEKLRSGRAAVLLFCALIFSVPHYTLFLKMTHFKEQTYAQLLGVLRKQRIKYVSTDFIIAYPIYFLSDRRIGVTDELGPVRIRFFYPWLRVDLERISWRRKAYLFFNPSYYRENWHIGWTEYLLAKTFEKLEAAGVPYDVIRLDSFRIVIPHQARGSMSVYRPRH
jgi:hypothetical protein